MINDYSENFDDIDLDEVFNDFNEKQSYIVQQPLIKWGLTSNTNQDDLTEFNESDCTAPTVSRKRTKNRKKTNATQMTMYDYASSISYRHKQFYSSLDNTTSTKTIIKAPKRPLIEHSQSTSISKKPKIDNYTKSTLSPSTPPDLIDSLLKYLDERSHHTKEYSIKEAENSKTDEIKKKKKKSAIL